jgi:hypothetical protein
MQPIWVRSVSFDLLVNIHPVITSNWLRSAVFRSRPAPRWPPGFREEEQPALLPM